MKKNAMLKIAAILLVAVLLTTCAISATFAKYTASGESAATARVAKWGVDVTTDFMSSNVLFEETYGTATTSSDTAGHVVATDPVVAPGTYKSLSIANAVTGTPEVSGVIKITAEIQFTGDWEDANGAEYCPIEFKVGNGDWIKIGTTDGVDDMAGLVTYVQDAIETEGKIFFNVGDNLATKASALNIAWRWQLTGNNDAADTLLGDNAADGNAAGISINFAIDVEQTGPAAAA